MSDNIVYEINRLLSDKNMLRSDMNDAAGLVVDMFRKKYINRLLDKSSEHRKHLSKNPPKEIQLINALRQFMPEPSRHLADKAIETYILADTFAQFKRETVAGAEAGNEPLAATAAPEQTSDSVHEDGVYDLDANCLQKKSKVDMVGMLMVMSMMREKPFGVKF